MGEESRAVEKEHLRFEGDLDKWMKIIGAGITGYQPEAYAVMDHACGELVRARAEIEALKNALRPFADVADFMDSETEGFAMTDTLHLSTHDDHFGSTLITTFCLHRLYTARELFWGGSNAE